VAILPLLLVSEAAFGETAGSSPDRAQSRISAASMVATPGNWAHLGLEPLSAHTNSLRLEEVLGLARAANPTLAEFDANRAAARAELLAALVYPNPEVEMEAGYAAARKSPHEEETELAVSFSQPVEWPRKRGARKAAAEASREVVEREREAFLVSLRAEVIRAYLTIRYYAEAVQLADKTTQNALDIQTIVQRRAEGGEVPEIDFIRARVESLKAARQAHLLRRSMSSARAVLDALCGGNLPADFSPEDPMTPQLPERPFESCLEAALQGHPALRPLEAVLRRTELVVERERAAVLPDLKVGVLGQREFDTNGVGASLEIEVPLWNRNQGGIAAAGAERKRIQAEIERTRVQVERDVRTAFEEYESAREQLAAFDAGLRIAAEEVLRVETSLYEHGETDLIRLLDARRTARETEAEYLQALYNANIAQADLELVMGIGGKDP